MDTIVRVLHVQWYVLPMLPVWCLRAQLKPQFQAKELDTEDCKWVLAKVVEK